MAGYEIGLNQVIANLRAKAAKQKGQLVEASSIIGSTLLEATRENAGLTDHSQEDLDSLGNPYSRRGNKTPPHPDYQIHIQTGLLYQNIEQDIVVLSDRIMVSVGVDENTVPYIADLIEGTSVMRPRDFLTETLRQQKRGIGLIVSKYMGP
jgi:hypothetical protein